MDSCQYNLTFIMDDAKFRKRKRSSGGGNEINKKAKNNEDSKQRTMKIARKERWRSMFVLPQN